MPSHNFIENKHPLNKHLMTHTVCRCVQLKGKETGGQWQSQLSAIVNIKLCNQVKGESGVWGEATVQETKA